MDGALVILSTVPDEAVGLTIGRALVGERLAACVNMTSAVRSIYRWEGKIVEEAEAVLIIKTKASLYAAVEARLKELHPYKVPEIVALAVDKGSEPYLSWIAAETL